MRRLISSKSNSCTEGMVVNAAGISAKVSVHYPGRSVWLPMDGSFSLATSIERWRDGHAEVSRGHSSRFAADEGLNLTCSAEPIFCCPEQMPRKRTLKPEVADGIREIRLGA